MRALANHESIAGIIIAISIIDVIVLSSLSSLSSL
jgi:hypothetical protein